MVLSAAINPEEDVKDIFNEFKKDEVKIFGGSLGALFMGRYGNLYRPIASVLLGVYHSFAKEYKDDKELKEITNNIDDVAKVGLFVKPLDFKYGSTEKALKLIPVLGEAIADGVGTISDITDIVKKVQKDGLSSLTDGEKEMWQGIRMLTALKMLIAADPISPTVNKISKSLEYRKGNKKKSKEKVEDTKPS